MPRKTWHSLPEYQTFRAMMESSTTAAAARRLGLSQSAVSRSLSNLENRVGNALEEIEADGPTALVAAGGVAANQAIRGRLEALCRSNGLPFLAPPPELCTDNAAMIAWTGALKLNAGVPGDGDIQPRARWPLDETAAPKIGHGRKGARA